MDTLLQTFMRRYHREYDYYESAASTCARHCEIALKRAGVQALITWRAKKAERLQPKIERLIASHELHTLDDLYAHLIDLSGVRIALYFPGDKQKAGEVIQNVFDVFETRTFPKQSANTDDVYVRRFDGYTATHYIIQMREGSVSDTETRYCDCRIEIQLASVLMHGWSEVEHDLKYKPLSGPLSEDEHAILDEINGIVLASEIAFERLQRAMERRVSKAGSKFRSHYELAAFLYDHATDNVLGAQVGTIGKSDVLFYFLNSIGMNDSTHVDSYLADIGDDSTGLGISERIIDVILSRYPERSAEFLAALEAATGMANSAQESPSTSDARHIALGRFLESWLALETAIRKLQSHLGRNDRGVPTLIPSDADLVGHDVYARYRELKRMRNSIIHGDRLPNPHMLQHVAEHTQYVLDMIVTYLEDHEGGTT